MDLHGREAETSPLCSRGGVSSGQKPLRFLWVALGRLLSLYKEGQGNQGKEDGLGLGQPDQIEETRVQLSK